MRVNHKLIIFLLFVIPAFTFSQKKIILNQNWQFRQIEKEEWYPATVPGYVHIDLLNNKLIEDPFFGQNETSLNWIEKEDWEYKTAFTADDKFLKNDHIELTFEGLDTYTTVYLNSKPVLRTDNMFREWSIDCKKLFKKGENEILIQFFSPVKIAQNKAKKSGLKLPGDEKSFVRKAAFQFGQDFAPRLISSGIWKPVSLNTWDLAIIKDIQIVHKTLNEKKADLSIILEITSDKPLKTDILISNQNLNTVQLKKAVSLKKGTNFITLDYTIDNPKLWWTNGLGEAYLYNFTCNLILQKQTIDSKNISTGLRTIELVQEKDSTGTSFFFKLNGVKVFMKGVNYVPQDVFTTRVDSTKQSEIINDAVNCNMNMLRIWGGGIYQDNSFYNLCDKNGILIWQDFMFTYTMYPGDSAFVETVKQEVTYQIKRLRNHPCITLWCGNNENIFNTIISDLLKKYDDQRPYLQSSPKFDQVHTESQQEIDSHNWGKWHDNNSFENYTKKTGCFMNEYGFQGMPDIHTINRMIPSDEKNISSLSILAHQKFQNGFTIMQSYMDREYKQPKDFEKFIYLSGLLQSYNIKTAIESHRRAKPYCMGSLYWQFNDCWPGISCSGIDYYGRWKPLQYFIKTAFNKILVSVIEENEEIKIYIISDKQQKQFGSLTLKAVDFSGKEFWKKNFIAEVPVNSSKLIYKIKTEEVFANRHRQKTVFIAELKEKDSLIAKAVLYFCAAKDLKLTKPEFTQEISEENGNIIVRLKAKNLVKNIYLSIDENTTFSNNYFDIMPGETIDVICKTNLNFEEIKNKIQIYSLFDSYITK